MAITVNVRAKATKANIEPIRLAMIPLVLPVVPAREQIIKARKAMKQAIGGPINALDNDSLEAGTAFPSWIANVDSIAFFAS